MYVHEESHYGNSARRETINCKSPRNRIKSKYKGANVRFTEQANIQKPESARRLRSTHRGMRTQRSP